MNGIAKQERKRLAIQELRNRLSDVLKPHHTDEFLLRWLRDKSFDQRKAERSVRQCLRARECYQIDDLPRNYKENDVTLKYGFLGFLGFDKEGTPIRYVSLGRGDFDGFVRSLSTFDICIFCAYVLVSDIEAMRKNDEKDGKWREEEILAVLDMEGFGLQQVVHKHVIETGFDLLRMFQDYYPPDILKRVLIVNAPVYFSVAFNIFKPILRLSLLEKLEVHARDSSPAAMLKYIDADVLPKFLGGNRLDQNDDPMCSAFIRYGGKVPESFYLRNRPRLSPVDATVKDVTVAARSIYDYAVDVEEAGTKIQIEFWTNDTILLHVVYKKKLASDLIDNGRVSNESLKYEPEEGVVKSRDEEIVSPLAKMQSHMSPIESIFHCARRGRYIFRFDNTYSWVRSKRLVHRIGILRNV